MAKPWWSGKKFRHPKTNNMVVFKSLPPEEQKRLNAMRNKPLLDRKEKQKAKLLKRKERLERRKQRKEMRKPAKITPETHPNFFTSTGKRLNTTRGFEVGSPIKVNPNWNDKTDNVFYATQINPRTGNDKYFYTENYIKKHNKIKFANNIRFGQLLPDIRKKINQDLQSENPRDRAYSTAIALVDQCAMRVGNKKSEADDVRGLHNLQLKNVEIKSNNMVELSYIGKKHVAQNHKFSITPLIKNNLTELMNGKSADDALLTFEKGGKFIRISPRLINRYLRKNLGSNVTVHHFRHHHASEIVSKFLQDQLDDKSFMQKATKMDVKRVIKQASSLASDYLGNTPKVAQKHYIDPALFQNFAAQTGFKSLKVATGQIMNKIANQYFTFGITDNLTNLTENEQKFQDKLESTKLEDLQPYENIDFSEDLNS